MNGDSRLRITAADVAAEFRLVLGHFLESGEQVARGHLDVVVGVGRGRRPNFFDAHFGSHWITTRHRPGVPSADTVLAIKLPGSYPPIASPFGLPSRRSANDFTSARVFS